MLNLAWLELIMFQNSLIIAAVAEPNYRVLNDLQERVLKLLRP